jgi:hypothetical protein
MAIGFDRRYACDSNSHSVRVGAVRDCKNHLILLDGWEVDDLPKKV